MCEVILDAYVMDGDLVTDDEDDFSMFGSGEI